MKKYILNEEDVEELMEHLLELGACNNNCDPTVGCGYNEDCQECWENWFKGRKL